MISTAVRRASSNDVAFLTASSTSRRTCSRRWADLRARSVFHGFSSSRVDVMITSTSLLPDDGLQSRGIIAPGGKQVPGNSGRSGLDLAQEAGADPGQRLALEPLHPA